MALKVYNPLEKLNLAQSIKRAILSSDVIPLSLSKGVLGAGVYVIYYSGNFAAYSSLREKNVASWEVPIYVGKAIPKGGRKGGMSGGDMISGTAISGRLKKHADSIEATQNLSVKDFVFRAIVLDDIWIPLGENILIETFQPLWNVAIDGFGINDPGKGRLGQKRSSWDVLHPGRDYAEKLRGGGPEQVAIMGRVEDYFLGRKLRPVSKTIT
jgi:Eco29kI restriction endonuclease